MPYAIKTDASVRAWELGAGSDMEKKMISLGKIIARPGGIYELFSQEAAEGKGQVARAGDFFKVDDSGYPYPNRREYFLANHRPVEGDLYEQIARPLPVWRSGDPETEEIRYLLDNRILSIHPGEPQRFFTARIWETDESAPFDAVIVFFGIERDSEGRITGVNFNFVRHDYFMRYYRLLDE